MLWIRSTLLTAVVMVAVVCSCGAVVEEVSSYGVDIVSAVETKTLFVFMHVLYVRECM